MKFLKVLTFASLIATSAYGNVSVYFNQNSLTSYTDPYRNISRRGDDLEAVLIKEVAAAKKTIFIAVQEIRLPLLAKALIEKHKEGVEVRIVLEHDYNFNILSQRDPNTDGEYEAQN